jgi:hypothetical protein
MSLFAVRDIEWLDHLEDGLAEGARRHRPVLLKPLGQGLGACDMW